MRQRPVAEARGRLAVQGRSISATKCMASSSISSTRSRSGMHHRVDAAAVEQVAPKRPCSAAFPGPHWWRRSRAHRPGVLRWVSPRRSTLAAFAARAAAWPGGQGSPPSSSSISVPAMGAFSAPCVIRGAGERAFSVPNSSLSIRSAGKAAQFTATKGLSARGSMACTGRVKRSFAHAGLTRRQHRDLGGSSSLDSSSSARLRKA